VETNENSSYREKQAVFGEERKEIFQDRQQEA